MTGASKHKSSKSKSSGLESKNFKVKDQDVEITCDTGPGVSTVTETTSKMLDLLLKKVDHQLSSANGSQLNVIGACDVRLGSTYNKF